MNWLALRFTDSVTHDASKCYLQEFKKKFQVPHDILNCKEVLKIKYQVFVTGLLLGLPDPLTWPEVTS